MIGSRYAAAFSSDVFLINQVRMEYHLIVIGADNLADRYNRYRWLLQVFAGAIHYREFFGIAKILCLIVGRTELREVLPKPRIVLEMALDGLEDVLRLLADSCGDENADVGIVQDPLD